MDATLPANRPKNRLWMPFAISVLATCSILFLAAVSIFDLRREVGARAEENAGNLLRIIERDVSRNFETLGLSLQAVIEGLQRQDINLLSPELRNVVLFDRSAAASGLGAFVVFDENGVVTIDSNSVVPRSIEPVVDRDYFRAQQDGDAGLFVSRPYRSRLIGRDVVGLSRRITKPDGSFGGVVLATIEVSYFSDLFSKLRLDSRGVITLLRSDGTILVRQGGGLSGGESVANSPVFRRMLAENSGSFVGVSRLDGEERLYTFAQLRDLPIVLTVALATHDIYADWFKRAILSGIGLGGISLLLIMLTVLLTRELQRRQITEAKLSLANSELSRLSITDALTGIGNRRSFEEILARELRISARTARKMSLILVDVDHFKKFNDRYGHHQGDLALQQVAAVLSTCACRPADRVFRVGGEEFAVILPETPAAAAATVAEKIRAEMHLAAQPHTGTPAQFLTLSLGVAEADDQDGQKLYIRADAALYRAKHGGRDQTAVAPALETE